MCERVHACVIYMCVPLVGVCVCVSMSTSVSVQTIVCLCIYLCVDVWACGRVGVCVNACAGCSNLFKSP